MLVVLMSHIEMDYFGLGWLDSMYSILKERRTALLCINEEPSQQQLYQDLGSM